VAAILRTKTPAEKFVMICDASETALQLAKAGMRYRNPGMSDEEVRQAVSARMLQ